MDSNMFHKRREKLDLFKAFRNKTVPVKERSVPDDLYTKCPACGGTVLTSRFREEFRVCPHCGEHCVLGVRDRLTATVDEGSFRELFGSVTARDPLGFPGYAEKLETMEKRTGLREAVITGTCRIGGHRTAIGVMDSRFIMGSMSSAVGEKITLLAEYAAKKHLPLVLFSASGGARMQEGIYSLMQMAKTSAAIERLGEAGCLYVSVLTNPTTGGVTASFASLGDIILAEPGALIGFAGPRVIEQTIKQKLPEGFQRAEFLQDCGFVDRVVHRRELRELLANILKLHSREVR
ncbi:MAG: acetyl-CoA carboxylase carboxyltransferase subunit beta [Clostridiales bacterium]|nr:acetyl-CoA carboxylase carboxyltransferase subunit beta [Clostridiales bacterium]